jgi:hypothetical protein
MGKLASDYQCPFCGRGGFNSDWDMAFEHEKSCGKENSKRAGNWTLLGIWGRNCPYRDLASTELDQYRRSHPATQINSLRRMLKK